MNNDNAFQSAQEAYDNQTPPDADIQVEKDAGAGSEWYYRWRRKRYE